MGGPVDPSGSTGPPSFPPPSTRSGFVVVVPRGKANPYLQGMQGRTGGIETAVQAERVREEVARAAERAGRDPAEVTVVAVTKGHPFEVVEAALRAGFRDLGENRVEALVERAARGSAPEGSASAGGGHPRWHMIGRLQRRQAPDLHGVAHLVQSVDSVRLAERLDRTLPEGAAPLDILVQANTSGEESKTGLAPEELPEAMGQILRLPGLRVRGLMTMAPFDGSEGIIRSTFRGLRILHETLLREGGGYAGDILSMGMSNDYAWAVEEGSTMIRLGTVLFGERAG